MSFTWKQLTYNLGRIGSYTLIGGLVGAVGGLGLATLQTGALQQGLYLLANGLLIAMGLYLMGLSRLVSHIERLGKPLWQRIQPLMQTLLPVRSLPQALLVGALWGWLPCGLVYSMLTWSAAAGSASGGALIMLSFGLGTLPTLFALGGLADRLRYWLTLRILRLGGALLLIAYGLHTLWIGLASF